MRIDKYLWCVRYFKTRSIATQACKKGSVKIDKTSVKPARDVYPGDVIVVRKDQVHYTLQVLDLPTSRLGAKLVDQYRKDITPKEAFSNKELLQYAKDYYRKKGTGRPSKKDRRDLEDFTESVSDD
ncbi:MAG: RNA-binding S4 domain-containing protein [Flavobacteriaceae bacterium]|jgi:ribosome-associated heat shock protein Hsp15|nr:RNA-binding S4 domain-containing protein [Flavobacteriaceae bacterium]|tara:strand:+ start:1831 stop:2208 length:378 start_codon:yes stop_codon:yes gene_type:complete